ncbi:MAG: RsmB/NOP family class I SAM-dependent RNA methyltransferase [Solirubrobacteraceae bacterium]
MLKHYILWVGIKEGLSLVFFQDKTPSKVVTTLFKLNKKWGKKDRSFVAETLYDIVRWKAKIQAAIETEIDESNLFEAIGVWFIIKGEKELPNFKEFQNINSEKIHFHFNENKNTPTVKYSLSNFLYNKGLESFGKEKWHTELEELNASATTILRVNSNKTNLNNLKISLTKENTETTTVEGFESALALKDKKNILNTEAYSKGFFEIQDASSQLVAPFLEVKPNQIVIDCCAGAGGKSLHLSNLMNNKGKIYALDIYYNKLTELERRKKLAGDKIIEPVLVDENLNFNQLFEIADRVLIDVPCSGIGTLKRNPGLKWSITEEKFKNIVKLQQELLQTYSSFLKPKNGILVYSTCSIFPEENQNQIKLFLKNNPTFSLLKEKVIFPSESGFDGFYMASLSKI